MFDYNCDLAQSYGIYENNMEFELAKYASSVNIAAGFHAGDPVNIRKAFLFASDCEIALGAHIGFPDIQGFGKRKMDLSKDELEAVVIYQIGAIKAYAKTFSLEIENVRCHGAMKEMLAQEDFVENLALAVKKVDPWLNLIVPNQQTKEFVQSLGLKAAFEVDFSKYENFEQIKNLQTKPDSIHFRELKDIKQAYEILKPAPINYNRVQCQI